MLRVDLKPCPYRHVDDDGHILCEKIRVGDREVSPNVCRACPVAQINCAHLRATLNHQAQLPLTVRYGSGKTEIWDDPAPVIALTRAACAAKVTPIHSPRDCVGCPLHQALVAAEAIPVAATLSRAPRALAQPAPSSAAPFDSPRWLGAPRGTASAEDARTNRVARKIIQLHAWLKRQGRVPRPETEEDAADAALPIGAGPRAAAALRKRQAEEKRVGWTD